MVHYKSDLEIFLERLLEQQRREQEQRDKSEGFITAVLTAVTPLTGRPERFLFIDAPGEENASAPVCSLGVLTFDLLWIGRDLLPNYTASAVASLILHEVGHTVDCFRHHGDKSSWGYEHFADEKSGYYAGRLGFKLDGVALFYLLELDSDSESHPPASSRYARFVRGYNRGASIREYRFQLGLSPV